MHRATKLLIAAGLAGGAAAWWRRKSATDRWQTDDPLPSLELPVPTAEPVVVPDLDLSPEDLASAPNRPHLTLLGDLPLEDPGPQDAPRPVDAAPATVPAEPSGNGSN